jgi:hypothetical protein
MHPLLQLKSTPALSLEHFRCPRCTATLPEKFLHALGHLLPHLFLAAQRRVLDLLLLFHPLLLQLLLLKMALRLSGVKQKIH